MKQRIGPADRHAPRKATTTLHCRKVAVPVNRRIPIGGTSGSRCHLTDLQSEKMTGRHIVMIIRRSSPRRRIRATLQGNAAERHGQPPPLARRFIADSNFRCAVERCFAPSARSPKHQGRARSPPPRRWTRRGQREKPICLESPGVKSEQSGCLALVILTSQISRPQRTSPPGHVR